MPTTMVTGKVDLVFRNASTGLTFVWYMNGYALTTIDSMFTVDPVWKIVRKCNSFCGNLSIPDPNEWALPVTV